MCLAIPGQIVAFLPEHPDLATVEVSGVRRNVNLGMLDTAAVRPGDWVLIHVGFAIATLDEAEAQATLAFLEALGSVYTDELDALEDSWIE
jgi:hydrogenase expression/formation protein HypC